MFPRLAATRVKVALADTPVVFVMGPRQCGKTTLVKSIIDDAWEYITLDDRAQFEIARADPVGFVRNLPPGRVALDEVQRVPELFVSIKQAVDEDRTPGRFLLTGSANALLLPRLSDSLAGRMESVTLTLRRRPHHGIRQRPVCSANRSHLVLKNASVPGIASCGRGAGGEAPAVSTPACPVQISEVMSLHEGNIARFRLSPIEFDTWRKIWR